MPGVKVKKEAKKAVKAIEKRIPQGGLELINDAQETIFNTELSSAADDHLKACNEFDAWKERRRHTERALIDAMKTSGHVSLRVGTQKVIKYKHIDAKDTLTLKDYKPAAPRGRRRRMM